jgi:hypothetical protein
LHPYFTAFSRILSQFLGFQAGWVDKAKRATMNGSSSSALSQRPTSVQLVAVMAASLIAVTMAYSLMWCAIWKVYIDTPLLMAISNILSGIGGALTTILVGRSLAQLNQPDEPLQTQIVQPKDKPVPVVETAKPNP